MGMYVVLTAYLFQKGSSESKPLDEPAPQDDAQVLALRTDRMATVRQVLADLTGEQLADSTEPVHEPGYPRSQSLSIRGALSTILNEECWHRQYAERDLDVLTARS